MRTIILLTTALVGTGCFTSADDDPATGPAAMQIDPGGGGTDNMPPIGWLDGVDAHGLASGWACDLDQPGATIAVRIRVGDGAGAPTYTTTASRASEPAVADACGGGNAHRFQVALPASAPTATGTPIYAFGVDPEGGPSANLSGSPRGFPDGQAPIFTAIASSLRGSVFGWTCDPDEPSLPLTVELHLGSTTAAPLLVTANQVNGVYDNRCGPGTDLHRFEYVVPASLAKGTWIYARPINIRGGTQPPLGAYQYGKPAVGELTSIDAGGNVTGWACDPDDGSRTIDVQVTKNGGQTWTATANLTLVGDTVDYLNRCGRSSTAHRFLASVGALVPGDTIAARAVDLDGAPNLPLAGSPRSIPAATPPPCSAPQLTPIGLNAYQGTASNLYLYGNKTTIVQWRVADYGPVAAPARIDRLTMEWWTGAAWQGLSGDVPMAPLAALSAHDGLYYLSLTGGTYRATIDVDAGGAVGECNEGDNRRQYVFTVQPCGAGYYCPP